MQRMLLYTIDYPPNRGGVARYLSSLKVFFGSEMEVVVPPVTRRRWWSVAWDLLGRSKAYDLLVVSHLLPVGTAAMIAGFLSGKPYAVVVHGMDVGSAVRRPVRRLVARAVLRRAALVVANSHALEREIQARFGVSAARTLTAYPPVSIRVSLAERTCETKFRLLTVARLVERKGHLRVLRALASLRRSHPELAFSYSIVGDGPFRPVIEQAIGQLRLARDVRLVTDASDSDLELLYGSSDVLVMPVVSDSVDREGFGMVYLEAAAYGIPSVATRMPGVEEAVVDGQTGSLVPDGDIDGLARVLYDLATDPVRRRSLGEEARRRALAEFTPERQFGPVRDRLRLIAP